MHPLSFYLTLPLVTAVLAKAVPTATGTPAPLVNDTASVFAGDSSAVFAEDKGKGSFDYCKYQTNSDTHGNMRNDLLKGQCKGKKVLLLFARGSDEPQNMGPNVGLPLSVAFARELGDKNVAVQGVYKYKGYEYPADINDAYDGGSDSGAQAFAHLIALWKDTCPETKLVIGGYSQGAQIAHKAVAYLQSDAGLKGKNLEKDIHGLIMFGDPDHPQPNQFAGVPNIKERLIEDCHPADNYCTYGGGDFNEAHVTYCKNISRVSHKAVKTFNL